MLCSASHCDVGPHLRGESEGKGGESEGRGGEREGASRTKERHPNTAVEESGQLTRSVSL
jgi:hypothetical protein